MTIVNDVFKLYDTNKVNESALQSLVANKSENHILFDLLHVIDFERYEQENAAYLVLTWFFYIPNVIQFRAETRFKIKDYSPPMANDTENIHRCIVIGMANYLMLIEERTGIDVRRLVPSLDKPKIAAISADILLQLRRKE